MLKAFSPVLIFLLTLAGLDADCRAENSALFLAKLKPVPVCATLFKTASTNHIPLDGIDASHTNRVLHSGDSVTILGTIFIKKKESQWLLYVEAQEPKNTTNTPSPYVVHMFGSAIKFESKPVPAKLRMLGPFTVAETLKGAKEQTDRFNLNESFLALGMDQAADVFYRRSKLTNSPEANAQFKSKLTPEEKRAIAGVIPSLESYFEIIQHTDGLENLLYKLVKLPSLWSIVSRFGVEPRFYFGKEAWPANPEDWALPPGTPLYYFPCDLLLNKQLALKVTFVVTAPNPPRLICAGAVGLIAEKPGDDETYMTLRLISAKCKSQSDEAR